MPAWITSLLREEVPLPMWPSASATMTSWPVSAACRALARPTTPAPTTSPCIVSPLQGVVVDGLDDGVVHWLCCRRRETAHVAVRRRPFNSRPVLRFEFVALPAYKAALSVGMSASAATPASDRCRPGRHPRENR